MTEVLGVDLHTLVPGEDGLRRDRWGRLLVVPPGATKAEGYTRVTTVAKALDEGGGLAPWKAAMAMTGLARRPGIAARWEALMAAHQDPWYSGPEVKAKVKELVEEAATAGGATDRRDQGEALHAITAQVDGGTVPHLLSVETQRDITAYLDTLARYGIEVIPGAIETTVVLDSVKVGGTFDRLVRVRGHELPMVADLKTGADIKYSDGAFAVQLAAYAHMEALYTQGPTPAQDLRQPPPPVDQHLGLIFWLPAGEGRCEVLSVDLDAGWEAFALSLSAREWRRRKGLMGPLSSWVAEVVPPARPMTDTEVGEAEVAADVGEAEVRDWLQGRIDVVGTAGEGARTDLGRSWPPGVPSLRTSTEHTTAQLDAIERALDEVEARHSIPFGPPKPGHADEVVRRINRTFPKSTLMTTRST